MTTLTTWPAVFQQICGLWPQFEPTDRFTEVFAKLPRQDLVLKAAFQHRGEPEGSQPAPSPSRLRTLYEELLPAHDETPARTPPGDNVWRANFPSIAELDAERESARRAVARATEREIEGAMKILGLAATHWGPLPMDLSQLPSTRVCILAAALDLLRGVRQAG